MDPNHLVCPGEYPQEWMDASERLAEIWSDGKEGNDGEQKF